MAAVAVTLPAPYEASDGRIEGRAPAVTTDIGVFVSGSGRYRLVTMRHLEHGGKFALPPRASRPATAPSGWSPTGTARCSARG
jgi:hypothetical protein